MISIATVVGVLISLASAAFGAWKWFNRAPDPAQQEANADAKREAIDGQLARDSDAQLRDKLHEFDRSE